MSDLTDALNRIEKWLQQHFPKAIPTLKSRLTRVEIEKIEKKLPGCLSQEVCELYQWKNGTFCPIFFGKGFFSLLEAMLTYTMLLNSAPNHWQKNWFPIFGEEEYYAVIIEDIKNRGLVNPSIICVDDLFEVSLRFSSLTSMMLTLAECYETGACYLNQEGYIEQDLDKLAPIWQKYNSEVIDETLEELQKELSMNILEKTGSTLVWAKDPRAVEILLKELQTPLSEAEDLQTKLTIRATIVRILAYMDDLRAVDYLIYDLKHNPWWNARASAAEGLGLLGDERAINPLIEALEDEHEEVRFMAVYSLVDFRAIEPLIEALDSESVTVRSEAVWALEKLQDSRAIEPLSKLLEDVDPLVRERVTSALDALEAANGEQPVF